LEVRLARIKDLIEELDRLGLKTMDITTQYAMRQRGIRLLDPP
jgi:hypothetical protein